MGWRKAMNSTQRFSFLAALILLPLISTSLSIYGADLPATGVRTNSMAPLTQSVEKDSARKAQGGRNSAVAPNRIIIKFRESVTAPADHVFAAGERFAAVSALKGDELDLLNEQFGVLKIAPLFAPPSPDHKKDRRWLTHSGRNDMFSESFAKAKQNHGRRSARAPQQSALPDLSHIYVLTLPAGTDIAAACRSYSANPNVAYAVPSYAMQPQSVVNDPYFWSTGAWGNTYDDMWGLKKIQPEFAWDTAQGEGIVVAVVDTGLDYNHVDIAPNVWANTAEASGTPGVDDDNNGYLDDIRGRHFDYATSDNDVMDGDGHGTFVAGIIAANGNNGTGIVGVAPLAKIMPVKIMASNGFNASEAYANGILYAALNGADIINLSWGCSDCSSSSGNPAVAAAISVASGLGAVVVTSAGNDRSDVKDAFPAGIPGVITVSSTDDADGNSVFSNRGFLIDVAAPGGRGWYVGITENYSILSLKASLAGSAAGTVVGGSYLRGSGTSASSAYVSGVAALVLSANPALTSAQVAAIIRQSADDQLGSPFDVSGYDPYFGWGRVNAARAVAMALSPPADPPLLRVPAEGFSFNIPQTLCGQERSFAFDIFNVGGDALTWSLTPPAGLTSLSSSGSGNASPLVKINASSSVSGAITVSSNGVGAGTSDVPVSVAVMPDIKLTNCSMALSTASGNQLWDQSRNSNPPAVPDGSGGAYYVWYGPALPDLNYKIYLQHIDSNGAPLWSANGVRVSSADKFQYSPTVISDGAGGAIVLWTEGLNSGDYADKNFAAQRVNSAGELLWGSVGIAVTQGGNVVNPVIVSDRSGGALVGWTHLGTYDDIYAQRISASGALLWQNNGYPLSAADDHQFGLQSVADGSGGAWFTWIDRRNPFHDVYGQHLDRDGTPLWPANGKKLNQQAEGSTEPNLVSDGAGGAIITWFDFRNHPMSGDAYYSSGRDIYAVHVDSAGQDIWSPAEQQLVAGTAVALIGGVKMLSDSQGGAILAWLDNRNQNTAVRDKKEIHAQRINGTGQPLWSPGGVKVLAAVSWDLIPALIPDSDGGALFAWQDKRFGSFDIFLQQLKADGTLRWESGGIWAHSGTKDQTDPYLVPLGGNRLAITWNDESNFYTTGIDFRGEIVQLCTDHDGDSFYSEGGVCGEVNGSDPVLTIQPTGPGTGTVQSLPSGISCGADCSSRYAEGSVITLKAVAAPSSHFSGWTGGGCSGNGDCTVTLAVNTTVRAQFSAARPVKITENSATIYTSPQQAYNNALSGNTITSWAQTFEENLNLNQPVSVQLKGGYDTEFISNDNTTTIKGTVVISNGEVTLDKIIIQ